MLIDRNVEREIMNILKLKLFDCKFYYQRNWYEYCADIKREHDEAETNYFIKCELHLFPLNIIMLP